MQIQHFGLFFSPENIKTADKFRKRPPFDQAWERLNTQKPLDLTSSTAFHALRYRINGDASIGRTALASLMEPSFQQAASASALDTLRHVVASAHSTEMLRDLISAADLAQISQQMAATVDAITSPDAPTATRIWAALAGLCVGIVAEDPARIDNAVSTYKSVINHDIHPNGYLVSISKEPAVYLNTLMAVQGLVLMAEAAKHIRIDLWNVNNRGVSVTTAGLYPLYYYYYPEQWTWGEQMTMEESQAPFRTHGTYLELLNVHIGRPTKAIDLILDEIRPVFDACGGGLTSLTHGIPARRGLFG